jgi:hypothetical protein
VIDVSRVAKSDTFPSLLRSAAANPGDGYSGMTHARRKRSREFLNISDPSPAPAKLNYTRFP